MIAVPQKATTVILFRERASGDFEVFLLKRHEKSSFMGGNYVYPGGRIDRDDHNLEICSNCKGITPQEARQVLGEIFSPEESLACWIAGIRELFEEAGILLAYDRDGNPFTLIHQDEKEWALTHRKLLHQARMTLYQMTQKEHLLLALDQLHYYARWITPEARTQRFDTAFFIARHPEGQEAIHDQMETTAGIWIAPREALKENLTGEVLLSPPTLKTLEDLSRFKTADEVFSSLKDRRIRPILPILTKISTEPLIIFPWDRDYERFQGEETSGLADHGRSSSPDDNTTRVVFRNGRWLPYCKP
jgi:8-oxo-dGTP pyrophosphatase MutT (NUDIX family)